MSTSDPNAEVTNPRLLVFPQDPTGFLYKLKTEVLRGIERQNGNPEKHQQLLDTMIVLAKFAKRRFAVQHATRTASIASAAEETANAGTDAGADEQPTN